MEQDDKTLGIEDFESAHKELLEAYDLVRKPENSLASRLEALENGINAHKKLLHILDKAEQKIKEIELKLLEEDM